MTVIKQRTIHATASRVGARCALCLVAVFAPLRIEAGEQQREEPADAVLLAAGGKALMPVVTAADPGERVAGAAADLAATLGRITGADFAVSAGGGETGIAVGRPGDFPALDRAGAFDDGTIAGREAYLLRSRADGLLVIGATDTAVEDAVWDLLWRIGYRQYFPGDTWEVVPAVPRLAIALDCRERPDYYSRRIWYGYGLWDYNREPYRRWCVRNRVRQGLRLHTGHAYGGIIAKNKKAFAEHPEYRGLVDGKRTSSKLCIGNPALRKLVCDYAVGVFDRDPDRDSISMDPSDGGGWCACPRCAALGSVSDRAVTLANAVAAAINEQHDEKYVGMYAYNYHSPPPHVRVHPNVIISVATAFIKGGLTLDEIIGGWARQGATIGIREYYSVNTWSRDLPGKARGGNLAYLGRTIPAFHEQGARFMSAESGDCWGPNGLGYYVAARLLWDVDEARRVDGIVDDFLDRAFGTAKEPMREFYRIIDGAHTVLVFEDRLARMFRALAAARRATDDPRVEARIADLVLYCRYVALYDAYRRAAGDARQAAFEALIRHTYRMRKTMMVHARALYRDLVRRDKKVSIPKNATWNVPEEKNPWKSSAPFTQRELEDFLQEGIETYRPVEPGFESVRFSGDLVPAAPLGLDDVPAGTVPPGRGTRRFFTWVDTAPAAIELRVTGGLIAHYRDRGNVRITLSRIAGGDGDRRVTVVDHDRSVPPDGKERTVTLRAEETGLHAITVADGKDRTRVDWDAGLPMTIVSTAAEPARLGSRFNLYFYVPKGTETLGFYAKGRGSLLDPDGNEAAVFDGKRADFYAIPVRDGQDGRLWKFHHGAGTRLLMTVPPCMARRPSELLLPRAVVAADATRTE